MGKTRKIKGTKTQLEYVEKDFKLHVQRIKCKNERQKTLIKEIENKPVIFVSGFAGTGKSFISIYSALKALEKGLFKKSFQLVNVINLDDIKLYNDEVQIKQKFDHLEIQTIKEKIV